MKVRNATLEDAGYPQHASTLLLRAESPEPSSPCIPSLPQALGIGMSEYQLPDPDWPSGMTGAHRALFHDAIRVCRQRSKVAAFLVRGSFVRCLMDEFSDFDLSLVTQLKSSVALARSLPEIA